MIDLKSELLVWHACPFSAFETIQKEGLRVLNESIYVGLHPSIPYSFAATHKHYGEYRILGLRLLHKDWTWGDEAGYEYHPAADMQFYVHLRLAHFA